MTITAIPDADAAPPRVRVDVAVASGQIMDSVSVWRVQQGERTLLRQQPAAGFSSRSVDDYECPYGVPVTYLWEASYIDQSVVEELWSEDWADLTAWTVSGGSWAVSAGELVWTGGDSLTATVTRALPASQYRVELPAPPVGVQQIDFGGFYIDVAGSRIVAGAQSVGFDRGAGAWQIDVAATSVALTTTAGQYSVPSTGRVSRVRFVGPAATMPRTDLFSYALDSPKGVAVSSTGDVYVVDEAAHCVRVFDSSGALTSTLGSQGTGDGEFQWPWDVVIDGDDNVYVADRGNFRIQKFDSTGTFVTKWGSDGTGNTQFRDLRGLFIHGSSIFAADGHITPPGSAVNVFYPGAKEFTLSGEFVRHFGANGVGDGQFRNANSVVVDSAGYVYILDPELQRIQKFTSAGVFVTKWGSAGSGVGQVGQGWSLAIDSHDDIYLAQDTPRTIIRYGWTGATTPHVEVGRLDPQASSTEVPYGITVDASDRLVASIAPGVVRAWARQPTRIGSVTVSTYGQTIDVAEETNPVTLTPVDGWLVHPAKPALSFRLSHDPHLAGIRSIDTISNASRSTTHDILGTEIPVTTISGARRADSTTLTVAISAYDEERAMVALLRDETPILVNLPPSMGTNFDYGFYQVGTTERSRLAQVAALELRDYVLPLQRVRSPAVAQQNSGWSYAQVAIQFASYAAVRAAYSTYADLAAGVQRSA